MIAEAELSRGRAGARNLVELFERQAAAHASSAAVRHKRDGAWKDVTWGELARRARDVSDGLAALGVKRGDRISILGETALEWTIADLGLQGAGAITVPIYQSNPPHECRYILDHSGASWIFVDREEQAQKIRAIRAQLPGLKGLIRASGEPRDAFERTLASVEALGAEWRRSNEGAHRDRVAAIGPDDANCIIYTSGTTGNPKGVVLTHRTWVFQADGVEKLGLINNHDVVLLFLPLAHSFARVIEVAWIAQAATAAFVESLDKLVDNAGEVKPTVVPAVPRIFEKAYNTVVTKGLSTPGVKGKLFAMSLGEVERFADATLRGRTYRSLRFELAKRLVFPKLGAALSERFGGRVRLFVSGAAPLSPRIAAFFKLVGFNILEGYGLTETAAPTNANPPGRIKIGTVGPAWPGTEIRIAEDGEILVRGGQVMKEYYRNPEATAEVIKGGWFYTGDIGEIDRDGYLRITDRKKDIIVTAGGKNVAPQNLENELKTDPLISQVMVHGDQRKFLSALVTLNEENARKWAAENGVPPNAPLHKDARVQARIQLSIDALNAKQASYSSIKKFAILEKDFTQDAGDLTPTLKVKRKVVSQKYRDLLESFYAE